jgi:YggT family protein
LTYSNSLATSAVLFLSRIVQIYSWLLFVRVMMSWFVRNPGNPIYHFLWEITEPVLAPIRRIMPQMGLDLSPIIAYLILNLITKMLYSLI